MTQPTDSPGLVAREPVMVAHVVAALLGALATFLVTHGVITSTQASDLTQAIAPPLVAVVLVGLGAVVRRYVVPLWKVGLGRAGAAAGVLTGESHVEEFMAELGLAPDGTELPPDPVPTAQPATGAV